MEVELPDDIVLMIDKSLESKQKKLSRGAVDLERAESCLLGYDNNKMVLAFKYEFKGVVRWIPEPDPVLILFDTAYHNYKQLVEEKEALLKLFDNYNLSEDLMHRFVRQHVALQIFDDLMNGNNVAILFVRLEF